MTIAVGMNKLDSICYILAFALVLWRVRVTYHTSGFNHKAHDWDITWLHHSTEYVVL